MRFSRLFMSVPGIALALSLTAQVFPSESGAAWRGIIYGIAGPIPFSEVMCGDTTINTVKYNKLHQVNYNLDGTFYSSFYHACTRVENQKVWVIAGSANQEILLYDFGVDAGDTLHLQIVGDDWEITYVADSIAQVDINGVLHKMIRFKTSYGIPDIWIEGIGSIMGPLGRGFFVSDAQPALTCYLKDGEVIYKAEVSQTCEAGLTCDIISGSTEPDQVATVRLFPNPADNAVWVQSEITGAVQIAVFSADGRLVAQTIHPDGQNARVSTTLLAPGIYLFRVSEQDRPATPRYGKVVVSH